MDPVNRFLGSLFVVSLASTSLFANAHGERLGKILAIYTGDRSLEEKLAKKDVDADFTDDEMRAVLILLESYLGQDSLKAHIAAKPKAFRHLRLRRLQAYFSLLGVFLTREQMTEVLRADFIHLESDDFTEFLTHPKLLERFASAALPKKLTRGKKQKKMLRLLGEAIETEGYPLPPNRAREILVRVVAEVEEFLSNGGIAAEPAPGSTVKSREELRDLLARLMAVGTLPEERKRIADELVEELPAVLHHEMVELFAGRLPFGDQKRLYECMLGLAGET